LIVYPPPNTGGRTVPEAGPGGPGSIPGRSASVRSRHLSIESFGRAVELGLSVKRETASGFEPRAIGKPVDSQLALCPSSLFRRVAGLGYRLVSAWSRVRIPPPAPDAGVAQWQSTFIPSSFLIRRFF